jgi:hypothetical protein
MIGITKLGETHCTFQIKILNEKAAEWHGQHTARPLRVHTMNQYKSLL